MYVCAPPGPVAVPPTHTPAEIDIQTPDTQMCVCGWYTLGGTYMVRGSHSTGTHGKYRLPGSKQTGL